MSNQKNEKIVITCSITFTCANQFQAEVIYKSMELHLFQLSESFDLRLKKNSSVYRLSSSKPTSTFKYPF